MVVIAGTVEVAGAVLGPSTQYVRGKLLRNLWPKRLSANWSVTECVDNLTIKADTDIIFSVE